MEELRERMSPGQGVRQRGESAIPGQTPTVPVPPSQRTQDPPCCSVAEARGQDPRAGTQSRPKRALRRQHGLHGLSSEKVSGPNSQNFHFPNNRAAGDQCKQSSSQQRPGRTLNASPGWPAHSLLSSSCLTSARASPANAAEHLRGRRPRL